MTVDDLLNRIIEIEWGMFTNVKNEGGRAACQDDRQTFMIMRHCQFAVWDRDTLEDYLNDLTAALKADWNLAAEKYARMMKDTVPREYEQMKQALPEVSPAKETLVLQIMGYHEAWTKELKTRYPKLMKSGRFLSKEDSSNTSIETYLKGELLTYSEKTLRSYMRRMASKWAEGRNEDLEVLLLTVKRYGYQSLEAVEERIS